MMSTGRGYVQVYYGDGKGKTTAAIGLAVRATGQGLKVLFLQFFKKNITGELISLQYLPGITVYQFGSGKFIFNRHWQEEDHREFLMGWEMAKKTLKGENYDLLIMDEFLYAFTYQMLSWDDFFPELDTRNPKLEVVLTGRKAIPQLIEYADLITNMTLIKHPYQQGIPARKGIEY
jgi:cob(I)alamin adenosyltransferase